MDYLGISQESSHLLISIITKKRHQLQILQNLKLDLTNSNDVKRLYNLIYDGEKKILITGLSASVFVLKTFLEKDTKLFFKQKKNSFFTFPFLKDKTLFTSIKSTSTESKNKLYSLLTTTKNFILEHIRDLKKISIEPDFISSEIWGLSSFLKHFYPHQKNYYLFHFSFYKVTCISIENNLPIKAKTIDLKREEAKIKKELLKIFLYFKKDESEKTLFITGSEKLNILAILCDLKRELNIEIMQTKNLFNNNEAEFALTLGLAIEHIKEKPPSRFVEKYKITTKKTLAKTRKKRKALYILGLLIIFFQLPLSLIILQNKKSFINKQKAQLLTTLQLPLNSNMSLSKLSLEIEKTSNAFNYFNKNISFFSFLQFLNSIDLKNIEIKNINYSLENSLIRIRIECIIRNQNNLNNFKNEMSTLLAKNTKLITENKNDDLHIFSFYLKEKSIKDLLNE